MDDLEVWATFERVTDLRGGEPRMYIVPDGDDLVHARDSKLPS